MSLANCTLIVRFKALLLPGLAAIVVAVLALSLGRHGGAGSGAQSSAAVTSQARRVTIAISNYAFKPPTLTVKAGTAVTWSNHDQTAHTATADHATFESGTINPGQSKTIDFKRPGSYTYHCAFHAFMIATLKVVR